LNIKQLVTLLQEATSEDLPESSFSVKGKKRAAPTCSNPSRTSKRVKMLDGSVAQDTSEAQTRDFVWPQAMYPHVSSETERYNNSFDTDVKAIPAFRHVYEIQYTRAPRGSADVDVGSAEAALRSEWDSEENHLLEIFAELRNAVSDDSEPRTIALANVHFAEYLGRLVAKSTEGWLLLLPSLDSDTNLEWHDLTSSSVGDICMAFRILQSAGRARMTGRVNLIIDPLNSDAPHQVFPFRLQITVNVSLVVPSIFEPINSHGTKRGLPEIGDAQRRVLNVLYPSSTPIPESFNGTINIPFFYSILRPAPSSLSPLADQAVQSVKLLPTLLPFQRRSIAWLLSREGKTVTEHGELVPKTSDNFTLWDKVEQGNHTWYLHRLSGNLSPSLPQTPPILGGILAEEPGLGKTLETIALILMNPAPHERNPTVKRWDPEAKLEVRAIKACIASHFCRQ
jgi:E3 ubiquitin-protein ligase SHPRH